MFKKVVAATVFAAMSLAAAAPSYAQTSPQEWADEGYQDCLVEFVAEGCAEAINILYAFGDEFSVILVEQEMTAEEAAEYLYLALTDEQRALVRALLNAGVLPDLEAISP